MPAFVSASFKDVRLGGTVPTADNQNMTAEQQLESLRKELARTWGRQTRWQRICLERGAKTTEEKIACAEEALGQYHGGTWGEGLVDDYKIRELRLVEAFGGDLPDDFGE